MTDPHSRLRTLFETYLPAVRRYAYHRAIIGVDADDLVAETFLVAWRRLDAVPADDPLPWLLAVAANVRRNQLRGRYRYDAAIKRLPRPDIEYPPDEPDERAAGLWAAIGALDEDDREILRL